jgi:hypothetical protein
MFTTVGASYAVLEKKRGAILKKIASVGPFIMATPTYLKVRCGNPQCKCADDDAERHEKLHLSWSDADGCGTAYVPVDLHKEVLEWIENYWRVKEYMKEMTAISRRMIKMYAGTVGKVKRRQARLARQKQAANSKE